MSEKKHTCIFVYEVKLSVTLVLVRNFMCKTLFRTHVPFHSFGWINFSESNSFKELFRYCYINLDFFFKKLKKQIIFGNWLWTHLKLLTSKLPLIHDFINGIKLDVLSYFGPFGDGNGNKMLFTLNLIIFTLVRFNLMALWNKNKTIKC